MKKWTDGGFEKVVDTLMLTDLVLAAGLFGGYLLNLMAGICLLLACCEIVVARIHFIRSYDRLPNGVIFTLCQMILVFGASIALFAGGLIRERILILCIGVTVAADAAGMLAGKACEGRHQLGAKVRLLENISPNKSYVGYLGSLIGAYAAGAIIMFFLRLEPTPFLVAFILLSPVVGAGGDLLASACKRALHINKSNEVAEFFPPLAKLELFTRSRNGYLDMFDSISANLILLFTLLCL